MQFEICLPASQDLTLNPSLLTAALEEHLGVPAAAANILRTKFLTAEKDAFRLSTGPEERLLGRTEKFWDYFRQIACICGRFVLSY